LHSILKNQKAILTEINSATIDSMHYS